MRVLSKKLGRELLHLKGQLLSIALVVAAGVMTIVTMRGTYDALVSAQESYYAQTRFADVWVFLKRAPESVRKELAELPGVTAVDTRVTFFAHLDLPDLDLPALGRFVSLPEQGRPLLNDIRVTAGRYLRPGGRDEVLLSEKFAVAGGFAPGETIRAVINGRSRALLIVGWAIAAEHAYAVPPGALYPEDERYGVLWMSRSVLGPAYDMDGAFNEVVLTLEPDANPDAALARIDQLLTPYGGLGAYLREDQPSHAIWSGELDQNRVTGTVIPAIFLAVAAFLLNLVLSRLIATQRQEVAVLKAFGYSNREISWHYLGYAFAAVGVGSVIGIFLGAWLGDAYVELYRGYFDFPDLAFRLRPSLVLIALAVSLVASTAGAMGALRSAVSLPPAEAMRPEPPARFNRGLLERIRFRGKSLGRRIPFSGRMIIRNMERRPWRTGLASVGVAFSVAILVVGMFMFDGVEYMMNMQFRVVQREDLNVTFNEPLAASAQFAVRNIEGVRRVEPYRAVSARLRAGHRNEEVGVFALTRDAHLRRIVDSEGTIYAVPNHGLVLSTMLAEKLRLIPGDTLQLELLEGERAEGPIIISGVVDDFFGLFAYMSMESLRQFSGESELISGAHLTVSGGARTQVTQYLGSVPVVASVASPLNSLEAFEARLADSLFIAVGFLLGFAGIISIAVVYNGARIALSERGRELASLRVMGFRRSEVSMFLLGEQALVTLFAIPLGWLIGYALSLAVVVAIRTEAYRIPLIVGPRTYVFSAVATVVSAMISALLVRRRVHRLDLIAVLKTRE